MRVRAVVALVVLVTAGLSAATVPARAGASRELLVCYPGKPGNTKAAEGPLLALTNYLAAKAGFEAGSLHATYFNDETPALDFVKEKKPSCGILSLALYLKWRAAGTKLSIVAQSERGGRSQDHYHVYVAPGSSRRALVDLKGGVLASTHLQDERFATKIVFASALDASKDVAVVSTKSLIAAFKVCASKAPMGDGRVLDGFVLDDDEAEGFAAKPEFTKLEKVWTSRPLPTPPVVAFSDNADAADTKKIAAAFLGMAKDAEGQKILETLQATGFNPVDAEAYGQVEKAY